MCPPPPIIELATGPAEMRAELEGKDEIISDLSTANEELQSYVDILMKSEGIAYKGKNISDVKKKK